MSGINKVILIGHLGKAPDLRFLADNVAVISFPMVTTEAISKSGNKVELNEWHNIVMWRALAESAFKNLKKGSLVYVEGKLKTRTFINQEDVKKSVTEIVADYFTLLGRKIGFIEQEMP